MGLQSFVHGELTIGAAPRTPRPAATASRLSAVFEVMGQVGVECHAVAGSERMARAIDDEHDRTALYKRGLARAGLVHRWVVRAAGRGARTQHVAAELGALAGQRRRQDLEDVAAAAAGAPLVRAHDGDRPALVEAQQLRKRQLESGGDPRRRLKRRARLATLDLRQHRRADAAALGEIAQREAHRLAQRANARAERRSGIDGDT